MVGRCQRSPKILDQWKTLSYLIIGRRLEKGPTLQDLRLRYARARGFTRNDHVKMEDKEKKEQTIKLYVEKNKERNAKKDFVKHNRGILSAKQSLIDSSRRR